MFFVLCQARFISKNLYYIACLNLKQNVLLSYYIKKDLLINIIIY